MFRSAFCKVIVVSILAVVLSGPALRAAEPRSGFEPAASASSSWGFLAEAWSFLARVWAETGCVLDPNGRCQPDPGTSSITRDNGCIADPNGRCQPDPGTNSITSDNGCVIDPDGRCIG